MLAQLRVLFVIALLGANRAHAANTDSLIITTSPANLNRGDTLFWQASLPQYDQSNAAVTLQVWIQSLASGRLWQYRYPLINGNAAGGIAIDPEIPEGNYAFNFLLQKDFFHIAGKVRDAGKKDTAVNYMLVAKDKETILQRAQLQRNGTFTIGKYLFEDTAMFLFSPMRKTRSNDLWVDLSTSLDSAFVPAASVTRFITIGRTDSTVPDAFAQQPNYHFDYKAASNALQLTEVTVTGKAKKKLEDFEQEKVSSRFRSIGEITFNGIDEDQIAHATDLMTFLMAHLPGVSQQMDAETGMSTLMYRNHPVDFFIDEFRVDSDAPLTINPADVALIRFLRPEGALTGGAGGTVAIYTKTGNYTTSAARKYTFYIRGYNPLNTVWK